MSYNIIILVMVILSLQCCKDTTQKHVVANPVSVQTPIDPNITASIQDITDGLNSAVTAYQAQNKATTEESVEFNKILNNVKVLDAQTLQSAVNAQAFSKADAKLDVLAKTLAADPNANQKKVNAVIHNVAMFTVILGGISSLAYARSTIKDYRALTKGELTASIMRGGLNLGAAIVAGFVLSQDAQPSDGVVIALGVLLGTRSADQLIQALSKLNASNEAIEAMAHRSLRNELVSEKFAGDVFAEADRLYTKLPQDKLAALQASVETRMKWGGIGGLVGAGITAFASAATFMGLTASPEETVLHTITGLYDRLMTLEKPLTLSQGN